MKKHKIIIAVFVVTVFVFIGYFYPLYKDSSQILNNQKLIQQMEDIITKESKIFNCTFESLGKISNPKRINHNVFSVWVTPRIKCAPNPIVDNSKVKVDKQDGSSEYMMNNIAPCDESVPYYTFTVKLDGKNDWIISDHVSYAPCY